MDKKMLEKKFIEAVERLRVSNNLRYMIGVAQQANNYVLEELLMDELRRMNVAVA